MILVTGGTGVMGSVLVRSLVEKGHAVRVFTLPDDPHTAKIKDCAADVRYGNIAHADDVAGICKGVSTVYHLAAVIIASDDSVYQQINVNGTQNIVNAAVAGRVAHFIHVSSASVVYPKSTPYSQSKQMGEEIIKQSGLPYTIIRPTLVYDTKGGQEFDIFLNYLEKFPVVPFIGSGNVVKRPVFVGDIIQGLCLLCNNSKTYGKVYNFSGDEKITLYEFARLCLRLSKMPNKPIVKIPVWFCMLLSGILSLIIKNSPLRWPVIAGVTQDADLDPATAKEEIGYQPAKVSEKLPDCFPRG